MVSMERTVSIAQMAVSIEVRIVEILVDCAGGACVSQALRQVQTKGIGSGKAARDGASFRRYNPKPRGDE